MEKILKDLLVNVKTVGLKQDSAVALAEIEAFEAQTNANEVMNTALV